ncbi:hypothetical protein ACLM5H_17235 [Fredinandcohnia humi]
MYYARLVQYKLGNGQRLIAEKLTREFDGISRELLGFRGNVYFFDDPTGEYRALNYWDTMDDVEHAHQVLFPKLEQELQRYTNEKPVYRVFEVFDASDDGEILTSHTITK